MDALASDVIVLPFHGFFIDPFARPADDANELVVFGRKKVSAERALALQVLRPGAPASDELAPLIRGDSPAMK
jgi:hypothetical protein